MQKITEYELELMNLKRRGAIMKYKKQSKFAFAVALVLTISVSFGATAIGTYADSKQTSSNKAEVTETNGILTEKDGFDVPADFAGKYTLFVQACLGKLEYISGTIEIGKVVDEKSSQNPNKITVPINIANAKIGEFIYLGEYSFSQGDKIHFNVSAATGDGLEVGLVSPKDDPLNRTHYTSSTKRYNGILEINSDSIFSDPVKDGQYKLFVHATDDLTNIRGNITITKQVLNLETYSDAL